MKTLPEQASLLEDCTPTATKRTQGGIATSNVTMSAFLSGNADVFPQILDLHVPDGAKIADVTYGTGVFWKKVDLTRYELTPSDIGTGVDCRTLPYEDGTFDAI
ncbi:MAG: site-specific DNA-methyltransferase, partial [Pseudomonadota bacterium]|nr:site-specific DNA-methyltransferase [Pseudomonadota bacterium]